MYFTPQILDMTQIARTHNKSLHPIWPLVPAFARRSWGAANAGPMVQTGELNR